jgi:uncharacterized protein (DUF433 family)
MPCCVNPDHLFLGTHLDNVADMVAKGRQARGKMFRGTKLTPEQVIAIRQSKRSLSKLAAEYGVSTSTISLVKLRRNWSYVQDPSA